MKVLEFVLNNILNKKKIVSYLLFIYFLNPPKSINLGNFVGSGL